MIFFSIDPGEKGAIVIWSQEKPAMILNNPYKNKRLDGVAVVDIFNTYRPSVVVMEDVHTSPRMGNASAGNFMYGVGMYHGIASAFGSELVLLSPQKWKAVVGLYGKPKIAALEKVKLHTDTFNSNIQPYPNRLDRAEAVLIGYAYQKLQKHGMVWYDR